MRSPKLRAKRPHLVLTLLAIGVVLALVSAIPDVALAITDDVASESPDEVAAAAREAEAEYWGEVLPWHPKLVHLPIALCIIMPPLTFGLIFFVWRGWFQRRTFLFAIGFQLALVISSLLALQTGHKDAEDVEGYAADYAMKAHDTRAHQFVYVASGTALLFLLVVGADKKRKGLVNPLVAAVAIAVAVQGYAGFRVGDAGGRLVYVGNAADAHK